MNELPRLEQMRKIDSEPLTMNVVSVDTIDRCITLSRPEAAGDPTPPAKSRRRFKPRKKVHR